MYWCIVHVVYILIHTAAKMDHALTSYFIIAAVWNGMEHRECIGGGEKTKQNYLIGRGRVRVGSSDKGAIISKYLVRVYLSNEQNKTKKEEHRGKKKERKEICVKK